MNQKVIGDLQIITLPPPAFHQSKTLFEALKLRRTSRFLQEKQIPQQILSDILWAGNGLNRESGPLKSTGRTAPSASNAQEIDIYIAKEEGTYLYEARSHSMIPQAAGDIRSLAIDGQGGGGSKAPVRLVYIVNVDKYKEAGYQEPGLHDQEIQKAYYYIATGLIAENVYLAAAAMGVGVWFHNCNKAELTRVLKLKPRQRALFGQTLGYVKPS